MFEAKLNQGSLLKKVLESIKELVTEANFDCAPTGFTMQAMDSSHVSLVALNLRSDGFEEYRCDRPIIMGMNLNNMAKMLKCAGNDDVVTIKAQDRPDSVFFLFENPDKDRISDFDLKLIDIDSENLGIPDTEHSASVTMSSAEFQRICRDLGTIGDTVTLDVTKDSIAFSTFGDIGTAHIALKHESAVDKKEDGIEIELTEPVNLTFALRYLNSFAKATPLSDKVTLSMSRDAPIEVKYLIHDIGYVKYYLAPKIEEDDE